MSRKKNLVLILMLAGICAACAAGVVIKERNTVFSPGRYGLAAVSIRRGTVQETIQPWYCSEDETYYYFLPSVLCGNVICNDEPGAELRIDRKTIGTREKFTWEDGRVYRMSYGGTEAAVKFVASSELPAVFIRTDPESLDRLMKDATFTAQGTIRVFETKGILSCDGGLTIHGRGNSTYSLFEKKPFNIELEQSAGLLGMGKDKDWCLLANAWDYSYMNNRLALDMASKAGCRYTPGAEYADLYFNGEYWGIYLVTEKVETDRNRISIADLNRKNQAANPGTDLSAAETFDDGNRRGVILENTPADITGGYLIERDYRLAADYPRRDWTPSYFETDGYATAFNIRSPRYADVKEVDYIRSLITELEQAIRSPDGTSDSGRYYLDYIDLSSWVRSYMIAEIAYDLDKDVSNTYYYKNQDSMNTRVFAGPAWDYDNRFGGTEKYASAEVLTKLASGGPHFDGGWSQYLYEKHEFYEAVCREWCVFFRDYLQNDAPEMLRRWEDLIRKSVGMDTVRWPRGNGYPVEWPGSGTTFTDLYSFENETEHLRDWIEKRCQFLDGIWGR